MVKFTKEVRKTITYIRLVSASTFREVAKWTGAMKITLGLASLFTILLCLMVVSILLGFPDPIETLIQDFNSSIRVDSTRLLAGFLFLCLIFPFLFLHQAATIHNKQESDIKKLKKQLGEFNPNILIEPIPPKHGVKVSSFLVRNQDKKKTLYKCFFRLSVPEIQKRHGVLYSKNISWADGKEYKDLVPNVEEHLNLLQVGKRHFRFLFFGDIFVDDENPWELLKEQYVWLSDKNTIITLTLTGFDKDGNQFQIEREYALLFFINNLNESSAMKIREIKPDNDIDIEEYFQWENDSKFRK